MKTIFRKELADYFTSWRVFILFLLVYGISAVGLWSAHQGIRGVVTTEGFVFLKLFTTQGGGLPPLTMLVHLIVPWIGIALGFDAINREYSSGTMSRILSQPLYRDSVINGKFLAGIVTLSVMLFATVLIVAGVGLAMIGVPPTAEEIIRLFLYLFFTIVFGAFWMGLAMLFSVITKRPATSFLSSFALWLFFSIIISLVAQFTANGISPLVEGSGESLIRNVELTQTVMRFSPNFLLQEASLVLLQPPTHGSLLLAALVAVEGNPLSLGQSLLLVWPHLTTLLGLTIVCFGISYVVFMRQEVRSA
ncbi:ABC transporter permease [Chloroflexota bacterium]